MYTKHSHELRHKRKAWPETLVEPCLLFAFACRTGMPNEKSHRQQIIGMYFLSCYAFCFVTKITKTISLCQGALLHIVRKLYDENIIHRAAVQVRVTEVICKPQHASKLKEISNFLQHTFEQSASLHQRRIYVFLRKRRTHEIQLCG